MQHSLTNRTVYIVAAILLAALSAPSATANNAILTPAGSAVAPDAADLNLVFSTGKGASKSETTASFGSAYTEIQVAALQRPGMTEGALSLESQVLPETGKLPSLAFGIRDIGNDSKTFKTSGYYGRSFYVASERTPVKFASAPYPFRNLSFTAGIGTSGIAGPFGSVSADLPLRLKWAVEWDSRNLNERIMFKLTDYASFQYERLASVNFLGFSLCTPTNIL